MKTTLVIACGALAHELIAVLRANHLNHVEVQCLPAEWHNTPDKITPAIEKKILEHRASFDRILVAYGDCGTGGHLDALLKREGIERLPGPHCYSFFAGSDVFDAIADNELGTFYLTDYLAANFDRLILQELGIQNHPELLDMYFGNYTRVLYLAQQQSDAYEQKARSAAEALGLNFEMRVTGLTPFEHALKKIEIKSI